MIGENKMPDTFYVTADTVVLTTDDKLLLIKRRAASRAFPNYWALPGGHVDYLDKSTAHAAMRELKEETGLSLDNPLLVGVFSKPNRDPRGPYISIAYVFFIESEMDVKGGDDAQDAKWFDVKNNPLPELAFDHREMVLAALSVKYDIA